MNRRKFLWTSVSAAISASAAVGHGFMGSAVAAELLAKEGERMKAIPAPERDWVVYECAGANLFPIYGSTGGLSTKMVCYLIRPKLIHRGMKVEIGDHAGLTSLGRGSASRWEREALAVGFTELEFAAVGYAPAAIERLVKSKLERAIKTGVPERIDLDGGSLPYPKEY